MKYSKMKILIKKMNKSKFNILVYDWMNRLLGHKFTKRIFINKYINLYKNSDIIFIHIPKSAGTSITNELYGKRNGHLTAIQIKNSLGNRKYDEKFSFTVTRNPYDRLVSSYFYAIQGGSKDGGISNPDKYKSYEFRDFKTFVKKWLVNQNLDTIDVIFRPQYKFIFEGEKCLVNYFGKLDELDEVNKKIISVTGQSFDFKHKNKSNRLNDFMTYYDEETKAIIKKLYFLDFKLLGYNF